MRAVAVAGLVAAVLVAVLATVALVRGGGGVGDEPAAAAGAAVTAVEEDAAIVLQAVLREGRASSPVPTLDELPTAAVLQLRVLGFEPSERGVARQCRGDDESRRCGNDLRVQFDDRGVADFQYLVRADGGDPDRNTGGCGVDDPPCLVTVTSLDARRGAELLTVFGDALPPPGTAVVEPRRRLHDGASVDVELSGLPPGRLVTVTTCVAGSTPDRARCGAPAPSTEVLLDADGAARTQLAVTRGPVGDDGLTCDDSTCVVAVLGDRVDVWVDPVRITFGPLPGADYDPTRLGTGLGAAALLAGLAARLVRRTDWSPVSGGAGAAIDDAEYADLDAMVAALPDEDASAGGRH